MRTSADLFKEREAASQRLDFWHTKTMIDELATNTSNRTGREISGIGPFQLMALQP